jgi:hypothetical protein
MIGESRMANDADSLVVTPGAPLAFTKGKSSKDGDVLKFCEVVDRNSEEVSQGIVNSLRSQGKTATAKKASDGKWMIVVGSANEQQPVELNAEVGPDITANITITANTGDIQNVLNALTAFFSNWRAVAGLIATGAAVVGGYWLMTINRQN